MTSLTIDVTRAVVDRTLCGPTRVIIDDGIITAIQPFAGATRNVTLVPGFVDLQVNGIDDVDVATATGHDWAAMNEVTATVTAGRIGLVQVFLNETRSLPNAFGLLTLRMIGNDVRSVIFD